MKVYHIQLSDRICALANEVHANLGNGFTAELYSDALEIELGDAGIPFARDVDVSVEYKGRVLAHTYTAGFIVDGKIILRVTARRLIDESDERELLSMLNAAGLHLGVFINFATHAPHFNRVVANTKILNSMNNGSAAAKHIISHALDKRRASAGEAETDEFGAAV
jgi:GxxExxY protein